MENLRAWKLACFQMENKDPDTYWATIQSPKGEAGEVVDVVDRKALVNRLKYMRKNFIGKVESLDDLIKELSK